LTGAACAASAHWLAGAQTHGVRHWLDNGDGAVRQVALDGQPLPLVLAEDGPQASYVLSPVSAWGRYLRHEAARVGPVAALAATPAGALLSGLMCAARLHRPALLGNWLVSTNLHPQAPAPAWQAARDAALALAPDRPLLLRNVCPAANPGLDALLRAQGWVLVPARRVYLGDPADAGTARRNNVKNDRRALNKAQLVRVAPQEITTAELPALRALFRQLFMDKHSRLNPDFSDAFFALCRSRGFLELHGLRHAGRLVGVVGLMRRHGWLTAPLLGYDLAAPRSLGLYRALMALGFEAARQHGCRLHYSSGAGPFKQARGGVPALEYTALFARHLPAPARQAAAVFAGLLGRAGAGALNRWG
jgi:hypothetical protein